MRSDTLHFFYAAQNRPAIVVYNGTTYAYVKNLQGDIVAILDASGNTVVSYGYDAWGAPLWQTGSMAETLGKVQPFRYRGYVYDEETGLYYLRSRYYASNWSRFINSDIEIDIGTQASASQLFYYCANNPINNVDPDGTWFWEAIKEAATAIGVVAGIVVIGAAIVAVVAGTGGTGLALIGGGIVADATVAAVAWNVANAAAECLVYAGATYLLANASSRTSARQMQRQVLKGQAPDEVDRVDGKHRNIPNSKDHIHFKDNTAINYDGTISHEGHGKPKLTRKIKEWITQNGWRYE